MSSKIRTQKGSSAAGTHRGNARYSELVFSLLASSLLMYKASKIPFISLSALANMCKERLGGPTNFLTLWGLHFTVGTFLLKVLVFFFPNSVLVDLEKLYRVMALGVEGVVSLAYWSIALIDPKLMVPEGVIISLADDSFLHLLPAVLLYFNQLFLSDKVIDKFNRLKISSLGGLTIHTNWIVFLFGLLYTSWIEFTSSRFTPKTFPYPFLNVPVFARYSIYTIVISISVGLLRLSHSIR